MERMKSFRIRHRCTEAEARDHFAYEFAKAVEVEMAEGLAFMDWMMAEGRRYEERRLGE